MYGTQGSEEKDQGLHLRSLEYAKNQAKWKAAREFCKDRMWEFKVLTENELGIK